MMDGGPWIGKELERKEKSCVECPEYATEPESTKKEIKDHRVGCGVILFRILVNHDQRRYWCSENDHFE